MESTKTDGCAPGKKYNWKTRFSEELTVWECRKSRDGNGLSWGIPGNPNSSRTAALKTCGWIFVGEVTP